MNETDFLIKTSPKWLEINKATANKPAIVLSQKFGILRNIKKYPFLENTTVFEKNSIFEDVSAAVKKTKIFSDEDIVEINLTKSGYLTEELLFEKDIIPYMPIDKGSGKGAGGIIAHKKNILPVILINIKNHLDIVAYSPFGEEIQTLAKLNEIDNLLGEELLFAYDTRLGFLSAKPEECGSGFFVEMIVHLPGLVLTEEITEVLNGISVMGARTEGVFNEGTDAWGSFFRIKTNFSKIENEDELVAKTKEIQNALSVAENNARKRLFKEAKTVMEDKIYRSFAIMKHARMLSLSQLFNFVSLLRLGIERKVFPMNMKTLNMLFERGWNAGMFLSLESNPDITVDFNVDIEAERAKMYRFLLQNINF